MSGVPDDVLSNPAYLRGPLSSWDEGTIVAALIHFAVTEKASAEHCIAALRAIGHENAADTLALSTYRTPPPDPPHSVKA